MSRIRIKFVLSVTLLAAASGLAGCASVSTFHVRYPTDPRECMARAMYFESNRSSDDGMIAVGTVVMNRVESGRYAGSVCGVVGQSRQFAPGVMTRRMTDSGRERAYRNAALVLSGKRTPGLRRVQFFHTAGYSFPYDNMNYVLIAGGNAFYEKTSRGYRRSQSEVALAQNGDGPPRRPPLRQYARADVLPAAPAPEPLPPSEPLGPMDGIGDVAPADAGIDAAGGDAGGDTTAIY